MEVGLAGEIALPGGWHPRLRACSMPIIDSGEPEIKLHISCLPDACFRVKSQIASAIKTVYPFNSHNSSCTDDPVSVEMSANDESFIFEEEQSPSKARPRPQSRGPGQTGSKLSPEAQKARDDALRQELASVRKVNEAIEGVLASLQKAKTNMKVG